ncbi:hypothetical protein [Rhodoflexus caldus]|uniref:hypothetical protein n=1 Tax=Rhodoflexus caldus TaxID=2891236 RepID=UPI00202A9040|nr:hypothetical protein [Rhodoflexus caldus]
MYHFATLFDQNYLSRGLTLRTSMERHAGDFQLFILCLDRASYDFFVQEKHPNTVPVQLQTVEAYFPELQAAKSNRSWVEYIFTLSPFWPLYILENHPQIPLITTMDADIFFFDSPAPLYQELGNKSILITPHRFSKKHANSIRYGVFNVSFQAFRNNTTGLSCLRLWKEQCSAWCYDKLENDRFADQKYLDQWPERYKDELVVPTHAGAGVAPWNVEDLSLSIQNGKVLVNGSPLIYYHFHHLRFVTPRLLLSGLQNYQVPLNKILLNRVYAPYIAHIRAVSRQIRVWNEQQITRYNKKYSRVEIQDLVIFGYPKLFINRRLLVQIHLEPIYRSYQFLKNLIFKKT